jgi:hypothetical protein
MRGSGSLDGAWCKKRFGDAVGNCLAASGCWVNLGWVLLCWVNVLLEWGAVWMGFVCVSTLCACVGGGGCAGWFVAKAEYVLGSVQAQHKWLSAGRQARAVMLAWCLVDDILGCVVGGLLHGIIAASGPCLQYGATVAAYLPLCPASILLETQPCSCMTALAALL